MALRKIGSYVNCFLITVMRTIQVFRFCLAMLLSLSMVAVHAKVYQWIDADGNVTYGDNPPKKSKAKAVDLPNLTVADSFVPSTQPTPQAPYDNLPLPGIDPNTGMPPAEEIPAYSQFKISSPENGSTLHTNGGLLPVNISLAPGLKSGDEITVYLDSRQVAHDTELAFQIPDVETGEHSLFAVLNDANGNIIQNTETVRFTLLRRVTPAHK